MRSPAAILVQRVILAVAALCAAWAAAAAVPTVQLDSVGFSALAPAEGAEMVRYVFDWGDGTQGTGSPVNPGVAGRAAHVWARAGAYSIRARQVAADGTASEWSAPLGHTVTAGQEQGRVLGGLTATASSCAPGQPAQGVADGAGWRSELCDRPDAGQWLVLDLGTPRTLNRVVLEPLAGGEAFPEAFRLEYCSDAGQTWYPLPRYDFSAYPNPGDQSVVLETGLLVARQLRMSVTRLAAVPSGYACGLGRITLRTSREAPFFTSRGGVFDADLNDMWNAYGLASNEVSPKFDAWWDGLGGALAFGSTEWHEWDVLKVCWADLPGDLARLRGQVCHMPMEADGYLWACDGGALHLGLQKHFDYNAINILAAWKYWLWTGEAGFFTDPLPAEVQKRCPPGTVTLLDKLRAEMDWQLEAMHGAEGLLRITDEGYDGTPASEGTTYWDAHPTGYLSAYPNALFYASVAAMAQVEGAAGDAGRQAKYGALLPRIKARFNAEFWEPDKGRFISTVDVNGARHDYGITATNLYAVVYGVADDDKAARVMEWLTGRREVAGDTAAGADIYHWGIAPRANTVAFEGVEPHWWAGDFAGVLLDKGAWGEWGVNIQNGGAIFYVSYYDLLARLRTTGVEDAFGRFEAILDEYHKGSLRPDTPGHYGPAGTPAFGVGVSTCFPESGLVPLAMLYGFLGVEPAVDGLHVRPALPAGLAFAGVRDLLYRGRHYTLTARRDARRMTVGEMSPGHFEVTVPADRLSVVP
jgi:hypothetical protein